MSVGECSFESTADHPTAKRRTQPTAGQLISNPILEKARIRSVWFHPMRVLEQGKRSDDLHILKLTSRNNSTVLGDPPMRNRSRLHPQLDSRSLTQRFVPADNFD